MNILYITNHLNTGGITSYVLRLGSALKANGHNIYVASSGGELLPEFIAGGLIYIRIPIKTKCEVSPKIIFSLFKLLPLLKNKEIELIHCNSRTTQVLGHLLSKYGGIPYISTCHGFFKKRLSRMILPCWGKRVIAISLEVRAHLLNDFKAEETKIRVINHGVDMGKFRSSPAQDSRRAKEKFGLGDWPVVGNIGRLSDVKGQEYLIRAMKKVLQELPRAQLLIIGEGRMKQQLLGLVNSLGISGNVYLFPSAKEMQEALSAMDLFVMPSLKEGLGLALMEAMAAGKAIVASGVGGIKTLIKDGFNGLLVPPKDVDGLTAAILRLLGDPEESRRLGENARDFIEKNFSLAKMVSETEKVYLECVGSKG
ncbi:MAG: glycosyltransferase family 4 protein [Candidatus Omnitrophota bacterium]|nr:glycosyltransferase family 4 protein [Candidatus Omnitrophota bacterium]